MVSTDLITENEKKEIADLNARVWQALWKHGRAGTWVGMENGEVKVRMLSEIEINEILELRNEGYPIPETVTIYNKDGTKLK